MNTHISLKMVVFWAFCLLAFHTLKGWDKIKNRAISAQKDGINHANIRTSHK